MSLTTRLEQTFEAKEKQKQNKMKKKEKRRDLKIFCWWKIECAHNTIKKIRLTCNLD